MKYSEMNERQKKAYRNAIGAINFYIGGWENTLLDESEGSDDWKKAYDVLHDHDGLKEAIYHLATTALYINGCQFNDERLVKDIRLCGKEWLMERIEKRLVKEGY